MATLYAWLSHGTAHTLMKELDGLLNMGSFGHAYFIHVECRQLEKTGQRLERRVPNAETRSVDRCARQRDLADSKCHGSRPGSYCSASLEA